MCYLFLEYCNLMFVIRMNIAEASAINSHTRLRPPTSIMKSPLNIFRAFALLVGAATVSKALICGRKMPHGQMYATPTIVAYSYYYGAESWGGWDGTFADCLQRCKDIGEECFGVHFSDSNGGNGVCSLLKDTGDGEWGIIIEDACDNCYYSDRECPLFCDTPGFCKGGMIRRLTSGSYYSFAECQDFCLKTESCGYFTFVGENVSNNQHHHCYAFDATTGCPEIVDEPVAGDLTCENMGCNTGVPCTNV